MDEVLEIDDGVRNWLQNDALLWIDELLPVVRCFVFIRKPWVLKTWHIQSVQELLVVHLHFCWAFFLILYSGLRWPRWLVGTEWWGLPIGNCTSRAQCGVRRTFICGFWNLFITGQISVFNLFLTDILQLFVFLAVIGCIFMLCIFDLLFEVLTPWSSIAWLYERLRSLTNTFILVTNASVHLFRSRWPCYIHLIFECMDKVYECLIISTS